MNNSCSNYIKIPWLGLVLTDYLCLTAPLSTVPEGDCYRQIPLCSLYKTLEPVYNGHTCVERRCTISLHVPAGQVRGFATTLITSSSLQKFMPFAVIGSDREVAVGGKKILGRQTKWGFIEVENKKHCEFSQLRDMLIRWVIYILYIQ